MTQFFNNPDEREKRRTIRANLPPAERILWQHLRVKSIDGNRFRRQHSIGPYVLDFYCPSRRFAIEVDGRTHEGEAAIAYDTARQQYIESFGIRFLRIGNADIHNNIEGVLRAISSALSNNPPTDTP